ncbi:EAL domain-containing protein [Aliivibrio logei]|uniref:EAL domain-containing protein n=1 Tax=Aliivibrio logei TaxID=688 RepID=UPI0035C8FC7E
MDFLSYSVLGSFLTQSLISPVLIFAVSQFNEKSLKEYKTLDRDMRNSSDNDKSYKIWLLTCTLLMLIAVTQPDPLLLNSLCFFLLVLIIVGFGKHGFIRPLIMAAVVILMMVFDSVTRVNLSQNIDANFYGLFVVLSVITALAYLLASHNIKNYELTQKQILNERIDPYTGLYNITQLKDDLSHIRTSVLIYLDITPTLTTVSDIGHAGRSHLIQQLSLYLSARDQGMTNFYRPPFNTGLLSFIPLSHDIKDELKYLARYLKKFQFFWEGSSITLVDPTLHCAKISNDNDIEMAVSVLCEQRPLVSVSTNWVDVQPTPIYKICKLSFIQGVFKNNHFELHCQPYLNLSDKTAKSHSFEVLLRIKSETGEQIPPAEFFPLINQFSLETKLDSWVIKNTFKMLDLMVDDWGKIEKCAINLTAKSLGLPSLAHSIILSANKHNIPLSRICFEITESSALQNEQQAIDTLNILREAGSKIALDDFGTGYASFAYLRTLPLDVLKIDGSFIKELPTNETDRLIVSSIATIAKEMKLETVAEFVETQEHIEILEPLGITYAQGYGIAKPRPLADYLAELKNSEYETLKAS